MHHFVSSVFISINCYIKSLSNPVTGNCGKASICNNNLAFPFILQLVSFHIAISQFISLMGYKQQDTLLISHPHTSSPLSTRQLYILSGLIHTVLIISFKLKVYYISYREIAYTKSNCLSLKNIFAFYLNCIKIFTSQS